MTEQIRSITLRRGTGKAAKLVSLYDESPGLCVHDGDDGRWTVTHVRSGLKIAGRFATKDAARAAAAAMARDADWTLPGDELLAQSRRYAEIRNRAAKAYGGTYGISAVAEDAPDLPGNLLLGNGEGGEI
jgi:hypothetical protein